MTRPARLAGLRFAAAFVFCIGHAAAADDSSDGVLTTTDGTETHVRYDELKFTGTARFVWSDGRSYSGDFVDGHPQGHGIEQLPDGSSYDGDWVDGRHEGTGTLNLADGTRYDGDFLAGARSGNGLFQSAAGRYQGEWADDVPQGTGRFDYTDGATYEGEWFSGRRNGFGAYRRVDGSNYEGDWQNDVPDGFGHLVESNGYTYDGGWRAGQRSGYGAMSIADTFGYEGTWVANVRQGYGRELRPDGSEYLGEWRDDQRSGDGILKSPDGASHTGHWENNAPVGPGTRVSAQGITMTGTWDGDFVASGTIRLPSADEYSGKLYDPNGRRVDTAFLAWLERIANQGNPDAALLLGQAYRFFEQPAPDRDKAILWYGRAADAGVAEAQYQLSELLFEDSATRQLGLEMLNAAAAQGHAAANMRLGVFFQLGTYVEKSHARAQSFYEVAIAAGDVTARNNLAWLLATSPTADLRNGKRAVTLAQPLAVLYDSWGYLDTLAAAQAEAGDFAAASVTEQKALAQAQPSASPAALQDLQRRLTLFQRDQPYREP